MTMLPLPAHGNWGWEDIMPDNKLSVDDILSELELARGKSGKQPIAQMDMSRINSIVEDVLTRKHEEKIKSVILYLSLIHI